MSPEEFIQYRREQLAIIKVAEARIDSAHRSALRRTRLPKNLRPARKSDIRRNIVLWYRRKRADGGNYWCIVDQPYGDGRRYMADDGCNYSIEFAFVETQPEE